MRGRRVTHKIVYPFTAIIGQDLMKLALILNAINPKIGGILIKGMKGTAKSTAVRALADILPEIESIKSCSFNCNPSDKKEMCHSCQEKYNNGRVPKEDIEKKKMRVITLPINATEDRVIGTIDINLALKEGIKALEPGILAEAHRNILYIDEVNLLADNVADVLLDSAAMGLNIIEREGISFHHPASFILVGTMNPEEGNLRPQLLDRFGLSVDVERIQDVEKRMKIVKYVEEFQQDPHTFLHKFEKEQASLREKILKARDLLNNVIIPEELLEKVVKLCISFQTDGHRADITIAIASKTIAAFNGRITVNEDDIKTAAKLSLSHRLRKLPFEDQNVNEQELERLIEGMERQDEINQENLSDTERDTKMNNTQEEIFEIDKSVNLEEIIENKKYKTNMNISGQRVLHTTSDKKGKYIGGEKPKNYNFSSVNDIAINETINKAAIDLDNQEIFSRGGQLIIKEEHLQSKKRKGKSSYCVIFCVDASGSMGVKDRMKTVKGAIFSILQSNYVFRDKVALVVFREDKAEIILPPTRSTDLAFKMLQEIPVGGTTPLVDGLMKSVEVAQEEERKNTGYIPLIILLTDARGNVYYNDAIGDVLKTGRYIANQGIEMLIIDTEESDLRLEACKKLSEVSNASYYHLDHLNIANLNNVLKLEGILEKF